MFELGRESIKLVIDSNLNHSNTNGTDCQLTPDEYDKLASKAFINLKKGILPELNHYGPTWDSIVTQYIQWIPADGATPEIIKKLEEVIDGDIRLTGLIEDEEAEEEIIKPLTCQELPEHVSISQEMRQQFNKSEAYRLMQIYIKYSKEVSPRGYKDYHAFCFLWMLSVIAARRICHKKGTMTTYTNLKIILCGKSSAFKKSTTANVAYHMIEQTLQLRHLLISAPDTTPEALISRMKGRTVPSDYEELTVDKQAIIETKISWAAQKSLYCDEYGLFMKKMVKTNSPYGGFVNLMLDELETCRPIGKDTIARQDETVEKPYLSLLACAVPATLTSIAKQGSELWESGFLPRHLPICHQADDRNGDRTKIKNLEAPAELVAALGQWHRSLGEPLVDIKSEGDASEKKLFVNPINELPEHQCNWTQKAEDRWYEYLWSLEDIAQEKEFPQDLIAHYGGRLAENMLRIAMLVASVDNRDGNPKETIITDMHMAIAQELIEMARQGLHHFYEQVTGFKTIQSKTESEIISFLKTVASQAKTDQKKWITVAQIRSRLNEKYSTEEIKKVLKPLEGTTVVYQVGKRSDSAGSYRIKD